MATEPFTLTWIKQGDTVWVATAAMADLKIQQVGERQYHLFVNGVKRETEFGTLREAQGHALILCEP